MLKLIVEIGALETKSPLGSNEPVTMTSSITGTLTSSGVVSFAKIELVKVFRRAKRKREDKRNFIRQTAIATCPVAS